LKSFLRADHAVVHIDERSLEELDHFKGYKQGDGHEIHHDQEPGSEGLSNTSKPALVCGRLPILDVVEVGNAISDHFLPQGVDDSSY